MEKSNTIMELVSGYETYSDVEELNTTAAADAPETSAPCGVFTVISVAKTYNDGC